MSEILISVNNVSVNFDYQENFISKKQKIHAVNNINIKIKKGSFFGLVGESGSGKTTLGRAILGANKISSGNVIFHDDERDFDLKTINKQDLKESTINFSGSLCCFKSTYDSKRYNSRTLRGDENNELKARN